MATIEQLAKKIAAMKAEHIKDIEQAIRDEYAAEVADDDSQPYTPPCEAPDGFEWVGEYRPPLRGEWCVSGASDHPGPAAYDFCRESPRHILRKLPKTWKPGDKAWVEVQIEDDVESDGEVMVSRPRRDNICDQYCYVNASALRETPGGGE